jgi:predicted ATP-grasp superfamily ATP-dependent carboligase
LNSTNDKINVIITNGWDRIAYNILRGLSKENLKVAFGTDNLLGMGYYSKLAAAKFIHHNYKISEILFIEDLVKAFSKFKPDVYIPTGEEIFAVSRNLELLSKSGVKIPVSDINTLEKLNNKTISFRIAELAGLPVPETIIPKNEKDIIEFINKIGFPVIIKKGWSRSAEGVCKVDNKSVDEIPSIIKEYNLEYGKFIVQKFVKGETYGVSVLMNKGEVRSVFTHKRLREKIRTGGPSTLRMSTTNSLLEDYAVKLLGSIKFHGVAMIEFKYDEKTDNAWFIECNPRFWGSVGLAINSGVNFPYLLYRMAIDGDVESVKNYKKGVVVEWWLGDKIAQLKNFLSFNGNLKIKFNSKSIDYFDDFYKEDPLPFFAWIYLLIRRKLVKLK